MGNWIGKQIGVHSVDEGEGLVGVGSNSRVSMKVRMTKRELKQLMAKAETIKGNSENLGVVILKECLEGRLTGARVVAVAVDEDHDYAKGRMLSTISEEEHVPSPVCS